LRPRRPRVPPRRARANARRPRDVRGNRLAQPAGRRGAMAFAIVGQPIVREEGPAKVTGAAPFSAGIPLREALWGHGLRRAVPQARIVRIDTSRAARVPGVRAILTGADFPPSLLGRRLKDEPIVARDRVRFVGERVAAVVADDLDAAEEALALIDVEYEE